MPIPGSQELRRPLLEAFKGEAPRNFSINEILEIIADYYGLNLNDFSSGDKNILRSRINEAKADLKKNNLLYNPSGNTYMITNAGTEILEDGPEIITNEYLKARKKKPLPLSETLSTETIAPNAEPEILPDDNTLKDSESDSLPENETLADEETPPEIDTNTDSDITLGDEHSDFDSPAENETLTDDNTPHDSDITLGDEHSDFASPAENETLTDDNTPHDSDITLGDEHSDFASPAEIETLTDDTAQDSDITLEDEHSDFEPPAEIETLTDDIAQDSDITLGDEHSDFEPPAEIETLTDNDTPQDSDNNIESEAMPEDDTFEEKDSGDFAEEETDEAPGEILDTEEVQTQTMPEDTYEPEETQEDLTDESDTQESHEEDYSEPESEEEYDPEILSAAIPSNSIDDAIARHNSELADQLLMRTAGLPSDRFEMLVIDLLSKMGYFAFQTARYTTESSGSEMIHGVILDNKTGANIYIQARKLSPGRTVSKADIQDFIDELSDKGGKGIYATTANFSENAKVLAADERLMLIDGEKLANLMIANNFCVSVEKVYEIKAIDSESFSEYE